MKKVIWFFSLAVFCFLAPLVFAQRPDPVGHWPFNEGSGSVVADVSGNGNNGVISDSGVVWSSDTPTGHGYSLHFSGKKGAVHIGDPDILKIVGDITLAAWVKTGPATESWQNIIVKGHGNGEIVMRVDGQTGKHAGTQIWCGSYDGADHMVHSYSLSDLEFNTWIHVVGVYSTAYQTWYLYFNGDEVAELVDPVGAVSVDRPWAIGARAAVDSIRKYPTERHFEGFIDDVRIYNVALSEDDVKALYNESISAVKNQSATEPANFALGQNYPNPFNPQTQIDYQVPKAANVNISVYNIIGQLVTTLIDEVKTPGYYSVSWNATDQNGLQVSSGIYIARMVSNNYSATRKLILLK
jgi:hypothetical protein